MVAEVVQVRRLVDGDDVLRHAPQECFAGESTDHVQRHVPLAGDGAQDSGDGILLREHLDVSVLVVPQRAAEHADHRDPRILHTVEASRLDLPAGPIRDPGVGDHAVPTKLEKQSGNHLVAGVGLCDEPSRDRPIEHPAHRHRLLGLDNVHEAELQRVDLLLRPSGLYGARPIKLGHHATLLGRLRSGAVDRCLRISAEASGVTGSTCTWSASASKRRAM